MRIESILTTLIKGGEIGLSWRIDVVMVSLLALFAEEGGFMTELGPNVAKLDGK